MARGRGKLTPQDKLDMQEFSRRLNKLLSERNCTQAELARQTKIPPSTLTGYVKGTSLPVPGNVQKIADYFGLKKSDIDPRFSSSVKSPSSAPQNTTLQEMDDKVAQLDKELEEPRHGQWIAHGEQLLEEQLAEQKSKEIKQQETSKPKKGIVSELFEERHKREFGQEEKSLHAITGTTASAAASGLGRGYGYDDRDTYIVYTEDEPPKTYSFATMVKGDSMLPDFQSGDMLYLHDKGVSSYSGQLAVVAYGDRTYFKKIYTEDEHLRLVSLNEKYKDILLDFPPSEDTHIRIFEVVGSFTPIEK